MRTLWERTFKKGIARTPHLDDAFRCRPLGQTVLVRGVSVIAVCASLEGAGEGGGREIYAQVRTKLFIIAHGGTLALALHEETIVD